MKEITAKFNSKCAETGRIINKGEICWYDPIKRVVYVPDSEAVKKELETRKTNDNDAGLIQAEQEAYFDRFCQENNI